MKTLVLRFARDEQASTAIEYGLIAGLLSIAILAGVTALSVRVGELYDNMAAKFVAPA